MGKNSVPPPLSGFTSIYSSFSENMHATSGTNAEAAYEIWLNDGRTMATIQHDFSAGDPGALPSIYRDVRRPVRCPGAEMELVTNGSEIIPQRRTAASSQATWTSSACSPGSSGTGTCRTRPG